MACQCRVDVERPPRSGDGASVEMSHRRHVHRQRGVCTPQKNVFRSTSWRNTLEKPTAGDAPCRNIMERPRPRREITSAAGAWETARPLRHALTGG